jgi:histidinol-phosphate/aromatic aminotransferase/cobyric acid decarboxylase-like protein
MPSTVSQASVPAPGAPGPEVPGPGAHGGDAAAVAAALGLDAAAMIDLSASLNPFAPPVDRLATDELTRPGSRALTSYPDPRRAAAQMAEAIGVDPELLVLTNGGAEAIALVAQQVGTGAVVDPEFSLYRRHLGRVDPTAPRWRSNPSSPEGCLAGPTDVAGVWDEAFYPLATGRWTRGDADAWRLGSLTKLWGCPGLRLGYVIAPDQPAAAAIGATQPQWAVNGLALALVEPLLERTQLASWARQIADLRTLFAGELARLGFRVRTTAANWVLVDLPGLRGALAPHRVVVRDCMSFGLPGLHRVALPSPDRLDEVLAAFAAVVPSSS